MSLYNQKPKPWDDEIRFLGKEFRIAESIVEHIIIECKANTYLTTDEKRYNRAQKMLVSKLTG